MAKCCHTYKPVVRRGPTYFFGVYTGMDYFGTDCLACTKCGKRRKPILSVIADVGGLIFWGALGLAGISLLLAFVVMCMSIATESWL